MTSLIGRTCPSITEPECTCRLQWRRLPRERRRRVHISTWSSSRSQYAHFRSRAICLSIRSPPPLGSADSIKERHATRPLPLRATTRALTDFYRCVWWYQTHCLVRTTKQPVIAVHHANGPTTDGTSFCWGDRIQGVCRDILEKRKVLVVVVCRWALSDTQTRGKVRRGVSGESSYVREEFLEVLRLTPAQTCAHGGTNGS